MNSKKVLEDLFNIQPQFKEVEPNITPFILKYYEIENKAFKLYLDSDLLHAHCIKSVKTELLNKYNLRARKNHSVNEYLKVKELI